MNGSTLQHRLLKILELFKYPQLFVFKTFSISLVEKSLDTSSSPNILRTSRMSVSWEPLKMQIPGHYPRVTESKAMEMGTHQYMVSQAFQMIPPELELAHSSLRTTRLKRNKIGGRETVQEIGAISCKITEIITM